MTTLIVSDLHLGSRNSQAALFTKLLQAKFDRLILNGDTVNNLNFKKLKPSHWVVIRQLQELARRREVILIRGNHDGALREDSDHGPLDVLPRLLGIRLHEEYQLEMGDRHYLVLHGDRFDPTLHSPIITDAADWCYQVVQKVNKKAAKWLKRRAKRLGGVLEIVKQGAVAHARASGCQGVITGHTHFADDSLINDIHYLNSGCWVDYPCSFLLAKDDRISLCYWDERCEQLDHPEEEEAEILCEV